MAYYFSLLGSTLNAAAVRGDAGNRKGTSTWRSKLPFPLRMAITGTPRVATSTTRRSEAARPLSESRHCPSHTIHPGLSVRIEVCVREASHSYLSESYFVTSIIKENLQQFLKGLFICSLPCTAVYLANGPAGDNGVHRWLFQCPCPLCPAIRSR
jgi:hypothetical protein